VAPTGIRYSSTANYRGKENSTSNERVRKRRNGEGREIGKGTKAPYRTLGFITIVEGCRDKARWESKGFQDQYHAFIHLPLTSSIFDLRPFLTFREATRQGERNRKRERGAGARARNIDHPFSANYVFCFRFGRL